MGNAVLSRGRLTPPPGICLTGREPVAPPSKGHRWHVTRFLSRLFCLVGVHVEAALREIEAADVARNVRSAVAPRPATVALPARRAMSW
jgi:hypothetical protein